MKRVFLMVLDSCGAGAQPDAAAFGDAGSNTLRSCHESGALHIPNLVKAGIGNIEGLEFLGVFSNPHLYSLAYNGAYMLPNTVIALVLAGALYVPMKKFFAGSDLKQ